MLLGVSSDPFGGFISTKKLCHALGKCASELLISYADLVLSFFLSRPSFLDPFFSILRKSQLNTALFIRIRRKSLLET